MKKKRGMDDPPDVSRPEGFPIPYGQPIVFGQVYPCSACNGSGKKGSGWCSRCSGNGWFKKGELHEG